MEFGYCPLDKHCKGTILLFSPHCLCDSGDNDGMEFWLGDPSFDTDSLLFVS